MSRLSHYFLLIRPLSFNRLKMIAVDSTCKLPWLSCNRRQISYRIRRPRSFSINSRRLRRLPFDRTSAMAKDPIFDPDWSEWIYIVRRQVGIVDLADLIFGERSLFRAVSATWPKVMRSLATKRADRWAIGTNPLLLFAALQRHLGYQSCRDLNQQMNRRICRCSSAASSGWKPGSSWRMSKRAIDLNKFYRPGADSAQNPAWRPPGKIVLNAFRTLRSLLFWNGGSTMRRSGPAVLSDVVGFQSRTIENGF